MHSGFVWTNNEIGSNMQLYGETHPVDDEFFW